MSLFCRLYFLFFDDTSLNNYAAFYKWQKILYIKKLYFFRIVSNENMTYTLIDSLSEIPSSKLLEKISKSSIIYPLLFFIRQCICIHLTIPADDNFCLFQKQNQATLLISKCIKNLLLAFCHHEKLYWIYLRKVFILVSRYPSRYIMLQIWRKQRDFTNKHWNEQKNG